MVFPVETIPLYTDSGGVVRVGNTRVTIDTIVSAFEEGATAEEIAHQYPSVQLADIYSVIGCYLRKRTKVEEYLSKRRKQYEEVRMENEKRFDPIGIRERLMSRWVPPRRCAPSW